MHSYLIAVNSFISGIARVLDIGATFSQYNHPLPIRKRRTTFDTSTSDWIKVQKDLQRVFHEHVRTKK